MVEDEKVWKLKALQQPYIICTGCDLLSEPCDQLILEEMDPRRLSQLLPGEGVSLIQQKGDWSQIRAGYQPHWNVHTNNYEPYCGWIRSVHLHERPNNSKPLIISSHESLIRVSPTFEALTLATVPISSFVYPMQECTNGWHRIFYFENNHIQREGWIYDKDVVATDWLVDCSEDAWRWQLLESVMRLKRAKYVWGGLGLNYLLGSQNPGIDCSGLIHVMARRMGRLIPRDAKDQYRWLSAIKINQLQPGDLIFQSYTQASKIYHVLMVDHLEQVVESRHLYKGFYSSSLKLRLQWQDEYDYLDQFELRQKDGSSLFFSRLGPLSDKRHQEEI